MSGPALPATTQDLLPENEETASLAPSSQHEIALRQVPLGQELAVLSARLTDQSTSALKDVAWTIRNSAGDVVFDDTATTTELALQPGYYSVEAHYGAIKLQESFNILEGHSLEVRFVLNAGALRVLPIMSGLNSPEITSKTRVFSLSGKAKGTLVRESSVPGEVISLTAGHYRIESTLLIGNTVAVMDVNVQPGILSAVDIGHTAGIVRLAYVGAPDAIVEWEIKRGQTTELSRINGLNASIALRPGSYIAVARVGKDRLTASFEIKAGEARDIMLGN